MTYTMSEIKKKVARVAKKHDLRRVYLFGSYARGEADEKSDIDLVIDDVYARGFGLMDIITDFQRTFKKKGVDVMTVGALDESDEFFANEVKNDEVLIYEE